MDTGAVTGQWRDIQALARDFSMIYHGKITPEIECIRDCIDAATGKLKKRPFFKLKRAVFIVTLMI